MSIRTIRVDKEPSWTFTVEVVEVTEVVAGGVDRTRRYETQCILCDVEVGNFASMGEAECAGQQHECAT